MTSRLVAAVVALLVLTACGSGDDPTVTADASQSAAVGATVDAVHNDADIAFVNGMTPHHEGAVEMSALAATRAASEEVKALAERIAGAQQPEIDLMAAMADAWGAELEAEGGHGGGHSTAMPDDVAALEPLSGADFDREFLRRMIEHHEGALVMAQAELAEGENLQAKELAQDIVAAQEAEITEMERMIAQL